MPRRAPRHPRARALVVCGVIGLGGMWAASAAGASQALLPSGSRRAATPTTVAPTTTLPPVTTTSAPAVATSVPQASTDTTPTAQKSKPIADPAQKRLRWIIFGLIGLAVIVLIATIWFWRLTRPGRAVTVTSLGDVEDEDGTPDAAAWSPTAPTAPASPAAPVAEAMPIMAVRSPLPSVAPTPGGPPVPAPSARPPAEAVVPPPPPPPPQPSAPAPVAEPEEWPDPPQFEAPDPPKFVEPAPPVVEPEPTATISAVAAVDAYDHALEETPAGDEVWEPRRDPDPVPGDEQWRGIRPLGPVRRGDGS